MYCVFYESVVNLFYMGLEWHSDHVITTQGRDFWYIDKNA